jgi:AcrR family transcriptional regulator
MAWVRDIPPRPPADDPSLDARERIVRTAYELFRGHGVTSVGVDRIVADAAVAKTTLYRHFRSKEELVVAVLDRHRELWTIGWLEPEAHRRGKTPTGRLLALFDALDEWFHQDTYPGCLFTNTVLETHDAQSPIREAGERGMQDLYERVLRLARDAGAREPETLAQQLQLLIRGAFVAAVEGRRDAAADARVVAALLVAENVPA